MNHHGGNVIVHHRHIQPVLIRDWSPKMDGITATIWASRTTLPLGRRDRPSMGSAVNLGLASDSERGGRAPRPTARLG